MFFQQEKEEVHRIMVYIHMPMAEEYITTSMVL